jgi:ribonuclease III
MKNMNASSRGNIDRFTAILEVMPFQNIALLEKALTHSSYKYENPGAGDDNERLEFLGDAVIALISGEYLYQSDELYREGDMTRIRSNLVDKTQLAKFARELGLGDHIRLGNSEKNSNGQQKDGILSDVFEAVVGAYYLDAGLEAVQDFLEPLLQAVPRNIVENADPKGELQKLAFSGSITGIVGHKPEYVTQAIGSGVTPEFRSQVYLDAICYGEGEGQRKKDAEKNAAREALKKLSVRSSKPL